MNRLEVAELFKTIKRAYSTFEIDVEKVDFWHEHLKETPFELAKENLNKHIDNEKFPPAIADIRRQPETDDVTRYHEHLRQSAQDHFANMEEAKQKAVPPPESLRKLVKTFGS